MSEPRLVIVDGVRTPFSKMGTDLAQLGADELGRIAVNALLTRTGLDPAIIDEVIFGCVGQPADAANVARVIALRAGIPEHVPAITMPASRTKFPRTRCIAIAPRVVKRSRKPTKRLPRVADQSSLSVAPRACPKFLCFIIPAPPRNSGNWPARKHLCRGCACSAHFDLPTLSLASGCNLVSLIRSAD